MKKALIVATVVRFLGFERNDIKLLKELGYEVHCATDLTGETEKTSDIDMVRHQIDFSRSPFSKRTLIAYKQLKKLIQEEHFDLIHCHTPVGGILARLAARKFRKKNEVKVIYTAHGFHFFKGAPIKNWLLYYPVEWICSWMTDVLISINKEDYNRASRYMKAKKIEYIPGVGIETNVDNNISVDKHTLRKGIDVPLDAMMIVSVGEVNSNKNHQLVIKALEQVKSLPIYYVVCGNGSEQYFNYLKKMCNELQVSDKVYFLGYRTDIMDILFSADVFAFPSLREGLGKAALEAMIVGLPLISSNIHGIKDYTEDGESGCCIDPNSVIDMKNAILKMYNDKAFCEKCGVRNKEMVKMFDIQKVEKIMKKIYMSM